MAIIRKVFGPFAREINAIGDEVRWYFNGIRGDRTMGHWSLTYYVKTREFKAANIPIGDLFGKRNRLAIAGLPNNGTGEDVHPDAWLDDTPVMEGRITDILRQHLPPADIATVTALSITRR